MSQEKLIPADQTKCAELARFVVRTTFDDLPEAIAQKAVRHILDSIGAGTAGAIAPETTILTQRRRSALGTRRKNDPAQCRPRQRHRLSCF